MTLAKIRPQITRSWWDRLHPAYKLGTPARDNTRMLRYTADRGTVLEPVDVIDRPTLFPIGELVATPAAVAALAAFGPDPFIAYLVRQHTDGDWGCLASDDLRLNDIGLATGGRLLSAYTVAGLLIWVITEADRSDTTVLLPSDH